MFGALLIGLLLRFRVAWLPPFELDEAYHSLLSRSDSFGQLWRQALEPVHPPLLILLLHFIREAGDSELVFRLIPILAGAAFPWFVYVWLKQVWHPLAGFAAAVILAFSPAVIWLSTVVRQYTLGMFFMALALWLLEKAIQGRSVRWMIGFALALYGAILSSFATAFFAASLGIYFLFRWRSSDLPLKLGLWWAGTQAVALLIYSYFLVWQVLPLRASHQDRVDGTVNYFLGMFPPTSEDGPVMFFLRGTYRQFELLLDHPGISSLAVVLFLVGVCLLLWELRGRSRSLTAAWGTLLTSQFFLVCAASYLAVYPYGKTRQTISLGIPISVGIAIALIWVVRKKASVLIPLLLLFVTFWYDNIDRNPFTWEPRTSRSEYAAMVNFIKHEVPEGSTLLFEGDSRLIFEHYITLDRERARWSDGAVIAGGYVVRKGAEQWRGLDQVNEQLELLEKAGRFPETGKELWAMDTGWRCAVCSDLKKNTPEWVSEKKEYSRRLVLFRVDPELWRRRNRASLAAASGAV